MKEKPTEEKAEPGFKPVILTTMDTREGLACCFLLGITAASQKGQHYLLRMQTCGSPVKVRVSLAQNTPVSLALPPSQLRVPLAPEGRECDHR